MALPRTVCDLQFGNLDSSSLGVLLLRGFISNINDCLLAIDVVFRLRRITNKTNTTPLITIAHAPTVPPTVTVSLSEEGIETGVASSTHRPPSLHPYRQLPLNLSHIWLIQLIGQ